MTIQDLKKLSETVIPVFGDSTGITIDISDNKFVALYVDDAGDYRFLSKRKHIEECIEDIIKWLNHEV